MTMPPLLHAQVFGQGHPVLIVHGWEMSSTVEATDFEPIFATVPGYKRIYVDLPGMGQTPIGDAVDLDSMYTRLCDFIKTVISDNKFLLIGSSCGAYLCRALVHDFSSQIDGVFFRVPLVEPDNAKRDLDPFRLLVTDTAHMASLGLPEGDELSGVLVQTPAYVEAMRKRVDIALAAVQMSDGEKLAEIRSDTSRYCLTRALDDEKGFPAPTLILCGRHDGVVGYRDAFKLLEKYPRASFAVLDRGVHAMPVDEEDLFSSLVRDWLVRVIEWRSARTL